MKATLLTLLLAYMSYSVAYAQTKPQGDKEQIKQLINTYFDGWATGDTLKLTKIMHASCKLKSYRDGNFNVVDKSRYLSNFKPREREKGLKTKIIRIDITGNISSAKLTIETAKALYTDYFNLIKTNEGWVIADKVSTRKDK